MREKILTFIEKNSKIDLAELAIVLGVDQATVMNELEAMEAESPPRERWDLTRWQSALPDIRK